MSAGVVDELLMEREIRGLKFPVSFRIVIGLAGLVSLEYSARNSLGSELALDPRLVYAFAAILIGGIVLNGAFLYLLQNAGRAPLLGLLGLLGAAGDAAIVFATFFVSLYSAEMMEVSTAWIITSELPLFFAMLVVLNGLTLRPVYPLIVGAAATLAVFAAVVSTWMDPRTRISANVMDSLRGDAQDGPQLVITVLLTAVITAAVAATTAAARRLVRRGISAELENAELRHAQVELVMQQKLEALARLVAGISHELNTPLGAAKSGVQTQQRALKKLASNASHSEERSIAAAQQALASTSDALVRIERIESSLRSFAHLDEAETQRVDLAQELSVIVSLLPPQLDADRRVRVDVSTDLPPVVVRAREINQMLSALLRFGLSASREDVIRVTVRSVRDAMLIEVTISGRLLEGKDPHALFDVHLRPEGSRIVADFDMPTAQAIAHRHGGRITVESTAEHATKLTVRLPVETPPISHDQGKSNRSRVRE